MLYGPAVTGECVPTSPPSLPEYAAAVGELLLHLRDEGTVLSSLDQHLLASWWEAGFPLGVVLHSIRETGERLKRRKRPPRGLPLSSMRKVVEREGRKALDRQAASVGPSTDGESDRVLQAALVAIDAASKDEPAGRLALLADARESLTTAPDWNPSAVFVALLAASRCYYDGLLGLLPASERERVRADVMDELGPALGRMAPDAVHGTVQELIRRRLRAIDPVLDPLTIEEGARA